MMTGTSFQEMDAQSFAQSSRATNATMEHQRTPILVLRYAETVLTMGWFSVMMEITMQVMDVVQIVPLNQVGSVQEDQLIHLTHAMEFAEMA